MGGSLETDLTASVTRRSRRDKIRGGGVGMLKKTARVVLLILESVILAILVGWLLDFPVRLAY